MRLRKPGRQGKEGSEDGWVGVSVESGTSQPTTDDFHHHHKTGQPASYMGISLTTQSRCIRHLLQLGLPIPVLCLPPPVDPDILIHPPRRNHNSQRRTTQQHPGPPLGTPSPQLPHCTVQLLLQLLAAPVVPKHHASGFLTPSRLDPQIGRAHV